MKNIILGLVAAPALLAAGMASAQQTYGDVARVISATPLYERAAAPRRECRTEQVTQYEQRRSERRIEEPRASESTGSGVGTILGAVIGGVIGHQLGNSTGGRDHGTVAGALLGGLVGSQAGRDDDPGYRRASRDVPVERVPVTRDVQRCDDVVDSQERIVGYDVRYEYNGREFRTRMPFEPGPQIAVNVDVRPPAAAMSYGGPRAPAYRGTY